MRTRARLADLWKRIFFSSFVKSFCFSNTPRRSRMVGLYLSVSITSASSRFESFSGRFLDVSKALIDVLWSVNSSSCQDKGGREAENELSRHGGRSGVEQDCNGEGRLELTKAEAWK